VSTNQTIKSHATTREYTERYQQTDMAKVELGRYCDGCGMLPAWCGCAPRLCVYDGDHTCNHPPRGE
jgi:hypothetical protein